MVRRRITGWNFMACVTQGLDNLLLLALQCINLPVFLETKKNLDWKVFIKSSSQTLEMVSQFICSSCDEVYRGGKRPWEKGWSCQKSLWLWTRQEGFTSSSATKSQSHAARASYVSDCPEAADAALASPSKSSWRPALWLRSTGMLWQLLPSKKSRPRSCQLIQGNTQS